jgi:hypothetical protein
MVRNFLLLAGVVGLTMVGSWLAGQEQPVVPPVSIKPAQEPSSAAPDPGKLPPAQRHFYLSAKGCMEWLARCNKADGRFVPGYAPALRMPLEGDGYLQQAGAAFALARAAAFFQDARGAAIAKQALLTLLLETTTDRSARYTAAPEAFLNRLASAGLLLAAIHELPNPAADLSQSADELCSYLRAQQQPDGAFALTAASAATRHDIIRQHTGQALHGVMRSHAQRPAPWKLDMVRKACAYYHPWWKQNKSLAMIPDHTAAYTEAYLATKGKEFADCVFEMNDWLCGLQCTNVDARQAHWTGGFSRSDDGKAQPTAPDVQSAAAAESLADACRVARAAGDARRLQRYRSALENCLLFLTTLQYTEANTQHFADWYRQNVLVGGFHLSHQDGNLRIEYAQHALAALVQYLKYVAE